MRNIISFIMPEEYALFNILKILDELGTPIRDQHLFLSLEPLQIQQMTNNLIEEYGNIKTILNLPILWTPSVNSRSKGIPRQQNLWMLFRRDVSQGLYKAKKLYSVGITSKSASKIWKSLSNYELKFWEQLSKIAKAKHSISYPNYKYKPSESRNNNANNHFANQNVFDIESLIYQAQIPLNQYDYYYWNLNYNIYADLSIVNDS